METLDRASCSEGTGGKDKLGCPLWWPGIPGDWPSTYRLLLRVGSTRRWEGDAFSDIVGPTALRAVMRTLGMNRGEFRSWLFDAPEAEVRAALSSKEYRWRLRQELDRLGQAPPDEPIMMRSPSEALKYLDITGWRVERVIAGFERTDVLLYSHLNPERFREGRSLYVPQMLWCLDNGRWIGIKSVNVGYGGAGPSHAYDLLTKVGLDHAVARSARLHRFFDLDLTNGNNPARREAQRTDLLGLKELPWLEGSTFVVKLSRENLRGTYEHERYIPHSSSYVLNKDGLTEYEAWIKYLDSPDLPTWLRGPRTGRVFVSYEAARQHGFAESPKVAALWGRGNVYPLVIEQGRLQLWVPVYAPLDSRRLVEDETYEALATAGLHPEYLSYPGFQGRSTRYARRLRWTRRGLRQGFLSFVRNRSENGRR